MHVSFLYFTKLLHVNAKYVCDGCNRSILCLWSFYNLQGNIMYVCSTKAFEYKIAYGYIYQLLLIDVCLIHLCSFLAPKSQLHYTTKQTSLLMSEFRHSPYITCQRRKYLSTKVGLKVLEIGTWFDNQRYFLRNLKAPVNWKGS